MVTTIVTAIIAIANAIPVVYEIVKQLAELHLRNQIKKIEQGNVDYNQKRAAILLSISEAKDHEQKRILFSALNDIKR